MGRPPKTIESPPADTNLEGHLLELRNDEGQAMQIVKYLEGDSFLETKHSLEYCKSYVIKLIQTYCETVEYKSENDKYVVIGTASDKSELLLAACGLLSGFEFKPRKQGQRIDDYCALVRNNGGYNKLVTGNWLATSAATKIRETLVKITKELATKLETLKSENGGKLGFLNQVSEDLLLPAPRLANGLQPYQDESEKEGSSATQNKSGEDIADGGRDETKPPAQPKNKCNITLIIKIIEAPNTWLIIVIALLFWSICYEITNNGTIYSTIKDCFVNEDKQVEQIYIFNDDIILEPGESEKLKIGIYPNDADIDTLQYSSQDVSIAWTEKRETGWFVVAQSVWQEDSNHKTVISAQYRQAVAEKDVTILKPEETPVDNIPHALGGGENNADDVTLLSD